MSDTKIEHGTHLKMARCPHCGIAKPSLESRWTIDTTADLNRGNAFYSWAVYECTNCHLLVSAMAVKLKTKGQTHLDHIAAVYPPLPGAPADLPPKAGNYLQQALESLHAPSGAIMLAGSTVDEYLKQKGLTEGSLYERIDKAATDGVITSDMAKWAHQVRLEANDQRHADTGATIPTPEEAHLSVDFATALGEFMFSLPARVTCGIDKSKPKK